MNEKLEEYILQHIDAESDALKKINRAAHVRLLNPRMLSGHLQGRILSMLCQMIAPKVVLELGTFAAYSALCLAEGLAVGGVVHTVEHDDELEDFILENLQTSPLGDRVKLHIGDALQIIESFDNKTIDLAFVDADKRQYLSYYNALLPKMKRGGFILADNTLWSGKVLDVPHHTDGQTKGILAFNDFVATDERVEKVILPLRDGLTIIRVK